MTNLSIVGFGEIGEYNAKTLVGKGYNLTIHDPNKTPDQIHGIMQKIGFTTAEYTIAKNIESAVRNADILLHCVPMDKVYDVLKEALLSYHNPNLLVSGATSRKTPEALAFDKFAVGNESMVTIHDLFTPSKTKEPRKEIRAIVNHRSTDKQYQFALDTFGHTSDYITEFASVDEHDTVTAHTQIKVSHTGLVIASTYARVGSFPYIEGGYNHGLDFWKFCLAMRSASLPSHIYRNIQIGSPHGREIMKSSLEAELRLDELVASNQFEEYVSQMNWARSRIFGLKFRETILSSNDINKFNESKHRLNSHISYMGVLFAAAATGINPFDQFRATTPMHRSMWVLIDYLCNNQELWEESLIAPFVDKRVNLDDMIFREVRNESANVILQKSDIEAGKLYDENHSKMTLDLRNSKNEEVFLRAVDVSVDLTQLARQRVDEAKDSGLFDLKKRIANGD